MSIVDVSHLTYHYGSITALRDLDFAVPEGALYALIGPNGSGKTTLLQILMGLRRAHHGRVSIMGVEAPALTLRDRARIGYIAEGLSLPKWMRLEQLEAYLAPLYPTWDAALASDLRERFGLDPHRTIGTLSRGEHMKAALLCALAPRPRLLIMDEPFTGMDAVVKDDLVRGLLESSGTEGWTVLLCSHDIGELELLADWVGILVAGRMMVSEPMDVLHKHFKRVEITLGDGSPGAVEPLPNDWLSVERSEKRMTFLTSQFTEDLEQRVLPSRFPGADRIDVRDPSLREIFLAVVKPGSSRSANEVAA
jgi:ABC-2 type transport system ATP-binding protein